MIKSDLVNSILKKYPSLNINDIEAITDLFFKKIIKSLDENNNVELRGFGTISKKINKAKKKVIKFILRLEKFFISV